MLGFYTVPRIAFGPGALQQLSALDAARPLVVVDPSVAGTEALRRAQEELSKPSGQVEVVPIERGRASPASVDRIFGKLAGRGPDLVVGVGGGTAIDTARALWIRTVQPELPLTSVTPLAELRLRERCRFVAVPTTVGSGAEASWVARLDGGPDGPLDVASRELVPEWAIVDPAFAATLPTSTVAEGAFDLVAHALEALVSEWANPFSDAHARAALSAAFPLLGRLGRSVDSAHRAELQAAATHAGVAAANASWGLTEALARSLAVETELPHARLAAALLPSVLEFQYPSCRDRIGSLGPLLGGVHVQHRGSLTAALRGFAAAWQQPANLVEAGVPAALLADRRGPIVERALRIPGTSAMPRVPSADEAARLLDAAAQGAPVDF